MPVEPRSNGGNGRIIDSTTAEYIATRCLVEADGDHILAILSRGATARPTSRRLLAPSQRGLPPAGSAN